MRAFSLIELLVVIAVIGILAAILIPAIMNVRRSAMKAEGVSNLRAVSEALRLYANDHNSELPIAYVAPGNSLGLDYTNWRLPLIADKDYNPGYLGLPDRERESGPSPKDYKILGNPIQRANNPIEDDYATFTANQNALSAIFGSTQANKRPNRLNRFVNPARTVMVMDGTTYGQQRQFFLNSPGTSRAFPEYTDNNEAAFAFIDGHVEVLNLDEVPVLDREPFSEGWNFWVGIK